MFNSLTGTITGKSQNTVSIDTHGIEWMLTVPGSSLDALPRVGEEGRIFTYLVHTQDIMSLYGFASDEERSLFFDLLKVDGIGPKAAVKILTNIAGSDLVSALDKGDVSVLERIPGIGKKTAAKMLLALKGKLTIPGVPDTRRVSANPFEAVVASLVSMGYERKICEGAVASSASRLSKTDGWEAKKQTEKEDAVFRRALTELAQ